MPNLSIKDVPDSLAEALRRRAARNHRSLQGELMSIIESVAAEPMPDAYIEAGHRGPAQADTPSPATAESPGDDLMDRLQAIVGAQGIDTSRRLTRDEAHDRAALRQTGD